MFVNVWVYHGRKVFVFNRFDIILFVCFIAAYAPNLIDPLNTVGMFNEGHFELDENSEADSEGNLPLSVGNSTTDHKETLTLSVGNSTTDHESDNNFATVEETTIPVSICAADVFVAFIYYKLVCNFDRGGVCVVVVYGVVVVVYVLKLYNGNNRQTLATACAGFFIFVVLNRNTVMPLNII